MRQLLKMVPVAALAFSTLAFAAVTSRSKDIVVLEPRDLPQAARAAGQSMLLQQLGNGLTYLYIEQQQLGRLAIVDVTDPARIRPVAEVSLATPLSFDFASRLGGNAVLLRYRDGSGVAVLDLKNPKQPILLPLSGSLRGSNPQVINPNGFLLATEIPGDCALQVADFPAQDYEVVDSSSSSSLHVLATVKQVRQELAMDETGTTFLLGEDGLTVVRQPAAELRNRLESTYSS